MKQETGELILSEIIKINSRIQNLEGFAGRTQGEITRIYTRFDIIDKRFDAMDRRFDVMDQRFDNMDKRFDTMDQRFDDMEHLMKKGFDDTWNSIHDHADRIETLEAITA